MRPLASLTVTLALGVALGACGREPARRPAPILRSDPFEGSLSPPPGKDAIVVATVGEDKIYADDVARYAAQAKCSPREAVDELVDLMLLAQEARRRGLTDDPEVIEARQQARVRAYLAQTFEAGFSKPADVPQEDVDFMWNKPEVRTHFDHAEVRIVTFARFPVDPKKGTPEEREAAHRAVLELARRVKATPPKDAAELVAMGEAVGKELGVPTSNAKVWTTPTGRTVPEFANATFAIPKVGDVSAPVETKWGWDLIYLMEIDPEEHLDKAQAAPEIREKIFGISRTRAFDAWVNKLVARRTIQRFDERLDALEIDAPLGMLDGTGAPASPIPGVPGEPAP